MSKTGSTRRTQAQRREESRGAVLGSAVKLFGQRGYAKTSLEDIAADCGLTIRPIYHYFGNKKALFAAANDLMEQRLLDSLHIDGESGGMAQENWRAFLDLCNEPGFRQIVLVDSPVILGRDRWPTSPVMEKARTAVGVTHSPDDPMGPDKELLNRVLMSALAEIALYIAEAENSESARNESEALIGKLFRLLRD